MAINVHNNDDSILYGLVEAYNLLHQKTQITDSDGYQAAFHRDITSVTSGDFRSPTFATLQDSTPAATSLASSIVKANAIKGVLEVHLADGDAHLVADSTNLATLNALSFLPSDALLAAVVSQANSLKAIYNAHLIQSGVHVNNDTINDTNVGNAIDQSSANDLLNDIAARMNLHVANGPAVPRLKILP